MFQYICKKHSFHWVEYEEVDLNGIATSTKLQHVNRVFASNNASVKGMVYKYKEEDGKIKRTKVSNLPDSVFVFNDNVTTNENIDVISNKIDWQYYIDRAYERIQEFYNRRYIKGLS